MACLKFMPSAIIINIVFYGLPLVKDHLYKYYWLPKISSKEQSYII